MILEPFTPGDTRTDTERKMTLANDLAEDLERSVALGHSERAEEIRKEFKAASITLLGDSGLWMAVLP